ncbi:acyl-CoA dehydrogenase domain-containing protein, partial [Falsihalocynthiibacter sp. CO-5D18]
ETDLPLVRFAAADAFRRIRQVLDEVIANMPARWAALLLRMLTVPGAIERGPDDWLTSECSDLIYEPSTIHHRVKGKVFNSCSRHGLDV